MSLWTAVCRYISQNITPFAVLSTSFNTPSLTESVIVLTRT